MKIKCTERIKHMLTSNYCSYMTDINSNFAAESLCSQGVRKLSKNRYCNCQADLKTHQNRDFLV